MIGLDVLDRLPDEPFKVRHNGVEEVGGLVRETLHGFTYWNGERTFEIDDTYEVDEEPHRTTFYSPQYDSTIEISTLALEDAKLFSSKQPVTSLDDIKQLASDALRIGLSKPADPLTAAAVSDALDPGVPGVNNGIEALSFTISDDEEVLELLVSHPNGIAVRDNGEWVDLNLDEDNPTIEDMEWLDVTSDAITFWDSLAPDTIVRRNDVLQYALPSE